MKEKLIIKNFGPIKSVELDLGRFNILIGEQATGKSTVAKVLAVCRYFSYIVEGDPALHYDIFKEGLIAWGLKEYLKDNTYISYSCRHYSLVYDHFTYIEPQYNEWDDTPTDYEKGEFSFVLTPISSEFKNLLKELEKIRPQEKDFAKDSPEYDFDFLGWAIPTSFFLNDVKNVLDNPFYLPTQRGLQSIFDIGKNSIQNLSSALFTQLSKMDGIARLYKQEIYIEPLDIYYINRNGHGFIRKAKETEFYSLYNAASGYQSMIPIVLTIKYYNEIKKKTRTFIIEEPELDVFPSAQNKLIQYIVDKAKIYDSMTLITTHSPYTLTSINNLMYAYKMGLKDAKKTKEIIEEKYWLNPEDVSAYRLFADGTVKNIVDDDLQQIDAGEIDEVSRIINEKWDKLADIEFEKVNEN